VQFTVPEKQWTHVAVTYAPGGKSSIFVNGQPLRTVSNAPPLFGTKPVPFRIGCRSLEQNNFDGLADDLRIYSKVLNDERIGEIAADAPPL
jgi:hypothetical protein